MAEATQKNKRPTAAKRLLQNIKAREVNRAFKSRVRTAMRKAEEALQGDDTAAKTESLNQVYSMMDRGVKRGVFKLGRANRVKARMAAKLS